MKLIKGVAGLVAGAVMMAQAQEMELVKRPPAVGTFYLLSSELNGQPSPPFPFDPYQGSLPVYEMEGFPGSFVVADSPEDFQLYTITARALTSKSGSLLMSAYDSPPSPGEGDGDGSGGGGLQFTPMVFGSNDLWLEITNVVGDSGSFIIHTPTNSAYDLFSTTNLALDVPGLNGTNWVWVLRTAVGETNLVVSNLWAEVGFFRLGTMLDSDGDGLTDAYEFLVSHTDANSPDTDGDGLSDLYELIHGLSPFATQASPSLSAMIVSKCALP